MEIEIEYCVPCGLLSAAEQVEHALSTRLGERVNVLRFKPGHGGVFRITIDDELIFDKNRDGFDLDAIVERVRERAGSGQPVATPRRH